MATLIRVAPRRPGCSGGIICRAGTTGSGTERGWGGVRRGGRRLWWGVQGLGGRRHSPCSRHRWRATRWGAARPETEDEATRKWAIG